MLNGIDKIEGLTPEQIEQLNGLATGMHNTTVSLNGDLANLKTETRQKQMGSDSAAELQNLRQFKVNSELDSAKSAQDWEQATKLSNEISDKKYSSLQSDNDVLIEQNEKYKNIESSRLIDDSINNELDKLNVNPLNRGDIFNSLKFQTKLVDGKAMIGEMSQSDHIKAWAESENGKVACLAQNNSGGDGFGGNNTPTGKPLTLTEQAIAANKAPK